MWCQEQNTHADRLRSPVHVSVEMGQLAVFRALVTADPCSIFAADGNGLKPLNIALRKKQKEITSFLLKKQWSTITYGSSQQTLPLHIFSKLKKWGDRARDRASTKFGVSRSSVKVPISFCSNQNITFKRKQKDCAQTALKLPESWEIRSKYSTGVDGCQREGYSQGRNDIHAPFPVREGRRKENSEQVKAVDASQRTFPNGKTDWEIMLVGYFQIQNLTNWCWTAFQATQQLNGQTGQESSRYAGQRFLNVSYNVHKLQMNQTVFPILLQLQETGYFAAFEEGAT